MPRAVAPFERVYNDEEPASERYPRTRTTAVNVNKPLKWLFGQHRTESAVRLARTAGAPKTLADDVGEGPCGL